MAQWGSELSQSEIAAIDVAVRVTGQQTVTDLQTRLTNVQGALSVLKQQYQQGIISQKDFLEQVQQLTASQDNLTASIKRAQNQLKGLGGEIRISGQAGLQLAYALDDMQYGFSAIVNNIPGIVQSLGGNAGLAGALGFAAVTANVANSALKNIAGIDVGQAMKTNALATVRAMDLIRDPIRDATGDLKGLKEQKDAIAAKPLLFEADIRGIRALTREIEAAERAQAHFDAMRRKRSPDQEEAAKQIDSAVADSGGTQNVEDALIAIAKARGTYGAGSTLHGQIAWQKNEVDVAQRAIKAFGGEDATLAQPFVLLRDRARSQADTLREQLDQEQRLKIRGMLNLNRGDASRVTLQGMVEDPRNAAIFAANQVDTMRLGAGIAGAAPDRLFEHERRKAEEQKQKAAREKFAQAQRQAETEKEKEINQQVQRLGPGFDDRLQAAFFESERLGGDPDLDAARAEVAEKAAGRGVPAAIVGDVAAAIVQKAHDAALNMIQDGGKPKLIRESEAAAGKGQREVAAAARKDDANAKRQEREAPKIAEHARDMGFAQDFQRMTGANDAEANYAGKQIGNLVEKGVEPGVAAQQVYDQMMRVILKMQANQDALTGINSGAIQQLRMLDARADMTRQQIQGVGNNMRRMGNQRPTRNITFGF